MSRTRRFLGGLRYGYVTLIAPPLVGLWLTPFILHTLGQRDYGLWLVAAQVMAYLTLLDLGIVALVPRETAYLTGRKGGENLAAALPALLSRTIVIILAQLPIVVVAAAASLLLLPAGWEPVKWPLAIVLVVFVAAFPLRIFQAVLQGLQELRFLGRVQLLSWTASTVVLVVLLYSGARLYSLAASTAIVQLAPLAAAGLYLWRRHAFALPKRLALGDRGKARAQVASSLWVSLSQIAGLLLNGTDLVIIAAFFGPAAVVPYACTGKLITVLANQPQLLTSVAAPALSEIKASGDRESLFRVSSTLTLASMVASGAVFAVILAVNAGFVRWWVGAEQWGGMTLTVLFLLNMLARHLNSTVAYTLFCFGYERRTSAVALADGAAAIGLALVLVRLMGPAGALAGLLASALLVALPVNLATLVRETGGGVAAFLSIVARWAWRFAVVVALVGITLAGAVPARFVPLAAAGAIVLAAYAAIMWPVVMRGPLGVYTRPILAAWLARLRELRPGARSKSAAEETSAR